MMIDVTEFYIFVPIGMTRFSFKVKCMGKQNFHAHFLTNLQLIWLKFGTRL